MTAQTDWQQNCNATSDVEFKYTGMIHGSIVKKEMMTDGLLIKIEATGCDKDEIKVLARPNGTMTVFLPETEFYYPEVTKDFRVDEALDVMKSKVKYKSGLLNIHIPFKENAIGKEIEIEG